MLVHKHKRHREYKWQLPLVVDSITDMGGKSVIHTQYSHSVPYTSIDFLQISTEQVFQRPQLLGLNGGAPPF
jgi:hypothetical protein